MKHLIDFSLYEGFDSAIEWIDQQIRRYTGGPFNIRILINKDAAPIENFPTYPDLPDFLPIKEFAYNTKDGKKIAHKYNYWTIKFSYFWTISNKIGNQYLAKHLFNEIKKVPQQYWSDEKIWGGLRTTNNAEFVQNKGNWIILHIEPTALYYILDRYFKRETDNKFDKEWLGNITVPQMKQLVKEFAVTDFTNLNIIHFFK